MFGDPRSTHIKQTSLHLNLNDFCFLNHLHLLIMSFSALYFDYFYPVCSDCFTNVNVSQTLIFFKSIKWISFVCFTDTHTVSVKKMKLLKQMCLCFWQKRFEIQTKWVKSYRKVLFFYSHNSRHLRASFSSKLLTLVITRKLTIKTIWVCKSTACILLPGSCWQRRRHLPNIPSVFLHCFFFFFKYPKTSFFFFF